MPTKFTNGIGDDFLALEKADLEKQRPGLLSRTAGHLVQAPVTALMGIANSVATLTGQEHVVDDREPFVPPARGWGEMGVDLVAGGLLPMAAELALTGGIGRAAGIASLAKTRPLLGSILGDAVNFGFLGLQEDALTGAEQTAEGAAFGALRKFSKLRRILPATALGLGSKAFWDRDGADPMFPGSDFSQGDVAGLAGALSSTLIGGKLPWKHPVAVAPVLPRPPLGAIPNHFTPDYTGALPPTTGMPAINPIHAWTSATPASSPLPIMTGPVFPDRTIRRALGYDPAAAGNQNLFRDIQGNTGLRKSVGGAYEPYSAAEAADTFIQQMLPTKSYTPPQPMVEPVLTGKSALRSAQVMDINVETPELARTKSRVSKLPEFRRTEGGSALQETVLEIARQGIGAGVGYTAAEMGDFDPAVGIALGLGAVNMGRGMRAGIGAAQKLFAPIAKQDNMGSVRNPFGDIPRVRYDGATELGPDKFHSFSDTTTLPGKTISFTLEGNPTTSEIRAAHEAKLKEFGAEVPPTSGNAPKWHVTSEDRWQKIDKQGLRPLEASNWVQAGSGERYGGGKLHAFESFDDAVRWAADMDFHQNGKFGSGKIRIVKFMDDNDWGVDTNDPLRQHRAKGKWLSKMGGVKRENISESYVLDNDLVSKLRSDVIEPPARIESTYAKSRSEIFRQLEDAADTQRGKPEHAMLEAQQRLQKIGAPAVLVDAIEHVGDLSHRAQRFNAITNVREKVEKMQRYFRPNSQRWSWEKELEEGWQSNATHKYIQENGLEEQLMALPSKERGEMYRQIQNRPEIQEAILKNKYEAKKILNDYVTAHKEHNQPISEIGQLGKLAAMDLGRGDYTSLKHIMNRMETWLNDFDKADEATQFKMFTKEREGKLASLAKPEGGFIFPEMRAALGRGAIGGFIGGTAGGIVGGEEGAIIGAMAGAGTLMFGPAMSRAMTGAVARSRTIPPPSGVRPSYVRDLVNLARNWGQNVEEASGRALSTSAAPADRFLRFIDKSFEVTMPAVVKETLMKSRGLAAHLLDEMDSALTKVSLRFKPDEPLKALANRHLDGSLNKVDFEAAIAQSYAGNLQAELYGNYIMAGRESINGLQMMVRDGISDLPLRSKIMNSIDKYVTKSYRIFTDKAWEPTIQSMDELVNEMHSIGALGNASPSDIRTHLEQYVREVKQMKGNYGKAFGSPEGERINQMLLKERKEMSDAWRKFLGEITDPSERLNQTIYRLRPMAEAGHYFDQLSTIKEDGWLPHRFGSYADKNAFEARLLQDLQNATPDNVAAAQAKVDKFRLKWAGAQPIDFHPKFGTLQGNVVTRNVWDTLGTFDSFTNPSSPFMRGMAGFNTFIKLGRTGFNPITVTRQFLTVPAFKLIARAEWGDMMEAWQIMRNPDHPMRAEIMKNGIGNVDQVKSEFFKEFENITGGTYNFGNLDLTRLQMGRFDLDMAEKYARRGIRNWLDVYRLPDNAVRIGAYLSAKRRFAQSLGLAETHPDVVGKAISFTNRYTMNYDTVAPIIKAGRQVPFVNLFISYTAEMTRILKNLSVDLVKGSGVDGVNHSRMYAAAPLAMLAVLPELIQNSAEGALSPKDRNDWEKAKKMMPDYARTRYRMFISRNKDGQFEYTDFTPLIASDGLNQTVKALVSGDVDALAKVNPVVGLENTPALNIIGQNLAGHDLHTYREFRGGRDRIASAAKEILPPWFPGVGSESKRFSQAYGMTESGEQGLTNQKTGQRLTPQDFWQPYWSGVKTGSTNLSVLEQRAVAEAKRDIANEVAYLNDILKSDTQDVIKQQMLEKAKVAIAEIQETLRHRVEK